MAPVAAGTRERSAGSNHRIGLNTFTLTSPPPRPVHPMRHDYPSADPLERLARKRAGAKLGWYLHASVYILVNLLLITLSAASGRHWAVFPAVGWGIGLAVHGVVVFLVTGGGGMYERLVQAERSRIAAQDRSS